MNAKIEQAQDDSFNMIVARVESLHQIMVDQGQLNAFHVVGDMASNDFIQVFYLKVRRYCILD